MSSAEGSAAVGGAGPPAVASRRDAGALLMPPPAPRAPRRAGPVVLDEDEYVARLDAIITREYFPDVPKLRDTLRWLRATNSGDPARVREAQRAIQRRLDRERGAGDASPSFSLRLGGASDDHTAHTAHTLGSPASAAATLSPWDAEAEDQWRDRDPEGFPDARRDVAGDARSAPATPSRGFAAAAAEDAAAAAVAAADARLGIDGFLRTYTGEDNASFKVILERQNEQTRRNAERFARARDEAAARAARAGERVSTDEGVGTALSFRVEPVRNDMFFRNVSTDNAFRKTEKHERVTRASSKRLRNDAATVARNTRFEDAAVAAAVDAAARSAGAAAGHTPYDVVATPHIEPGVDDTPIVTWGALESTPVRLDGPAPARGGGERGSKSGTEKEKEKDAVPPACAASPFRLGGEDRRERTLRSLVADVDAKRAGGAAGDGSARKRRRDGGEGAATFRKGALSEAARALARRVRDFGEGKAPSRRGRGVGDTFEGSLRRAYTPGRTPRRPGSASATPARE